MKHFAGALLASTLVSMLPLYGQETPPSFTLSSARLCPDVEWGGFVIGEFLYWKAREDNFDLGLVKHAINNNTSIDKVIHKSFPLEPGFRVGGGIKTPWDRGDFTFLWTRFNNQMSNSKVFPLNDFAATPYHAVVAFSGDTLSLFYATNGKTKVHLDDFDLDWSRKTHLTKAIDITPRIGVRYTKIQQSLHASYLSTPDLIVVSDFQSLQTSTFKGFGLKIGLDTHLNMGYGLGVFANLSGSLYWSRLSFLTFTQTFNPNLLPIIPSYTFKGSHHTVRPMCALAMGLDGSWCFKDRYVARLSAGYEFLYWWNVSERSVIQQEIIVNDVSFQGFTIGAGLDF